MTEVLQSQSGSEGLACSMARTSIPKEHRHISSVSALAGRAGRLSLDARIALACTFAVPAGLVLFAWVYWLLM